MQVINTDFEEVFIFSPKVYQDERGTTFEAFNKKAIEDVVGSFDIVLQLASTSVFNTVRGLHYQLPPAAQAKLVSVSWGKVFDVVVDVRKSSPTFAKACTFELSSENNHMLYVPVGFAHGFCCISPAAVMNYSLNSPFAPEYYTGIKWSDKSLNIEWPVSGSEAVISEKDNNLPVLAEAKVFS